MQTADHVNRKAATTVQHLGHSGSTSQNVCQIFTRQTPLLHAEFDRLNRVRWIYWIMFVLVRIDKRRQYIKAITLWSATASTPQPLNFCHSGFVVTLAPNRLKIFHT